MKYVINRENYKKFPLFEVNKCEGRAYFIPYSNRETLAATSCLEERYKSDLVTVLSGEWDFHYYDKVSKLPQPLDTDVEAFDRIQVPSDWQRTGYEPPFYVNQRYQFPCKPPKIPTDIPVGVYRKIFSLETLSDQFILTFLGVISSLDVYINGQYVGYSEGAHNSAEFDVQPFLREGENELVASSLNIPTGPIWNARICSVKTAFSAMCCFPAARLPASTIIRSKRRKPGTPIPFPERWSLPAILPGTLFRLRSWRATAWFLHRR